jgi:hypothetical protein
MPLVRKKGKKYYERKSFVILLIYLSTFHKILQLGMVKMLQHSKIGFGNTTQIVLIDMHKVLKSCSKQNGRILNIMSQSL